MPTIHKVRQGDCISSIAFKYGFFPDTIWDHIQNRSLKTKRADPNVLMPGDAVFIPDKRLKEVSLPADQAHTFTMESVPAKLRIRFTDVDNKARGNVPYQLFVDGVLVSGPGDRTSSGGMVDCSIPPEGRTGRLLLGTGEDIAEYELLLGHLNPVDDISGLKQRLNNMGLYQGDPGPEFDEATKNSLLAFQALMKLQLTGRPDRATVKKLRELHDGI